MKSLHEFYKGRQNTSRSTRKSVYANMSPSEKKKLDKIATSKFGKKFIDCSWDEQSGLRSMTNNNASKEQDDVNNDIEQDAIDTKDRIKDDIDDDDEIQEDQGPCWDGYERVPGTKEGEKGSCRKIKKR